ncbi:hypothetical protein EXM22_03065 [Oceanispirochaeta crateris]|uniref:Outer membrane lipoprotein-sorting protein n=1 Tax=Oceanispirochaeta crateris TaxID=2518645 RepID=A0A5C1QG22_9SPIO|nr:DUF6675 family protein [Oceanispirochaeta crateris]QEN07015.1 hypothetical protein EXM22_03065 [Oceanispirochaeta crateris]
MMIQKQMILSVLVLLSVSALLGADPSPLKEGSNYLERTLNYVEDSSKVALMPDFASKPQLERTLREFKPSGIVELLYTMPLPETGNKDMMLHILQSLSAISTLEGIEYWSGSRQAMYPYLEEAYAVEKTRSSRKVADPVFTSLPKGPQTISVFQNDTTFGKTWYDVSFEVKGNSIRLSMINRTTIRYKFFPVLRDERLLIEMIIIPREEDLLFYGMAAFRLGNTFGIEIDLDESFDHRMSALQTWFSNQTYP